MFFKHFTSKNQLPGFYIGGTLVENGLTIVNLDSTSTHKALLINAILADLRNFDIIYFKFEILSRDTP